MKNCSKSTLKCIYGKQPYLYLALSSDTPFNASEASATPSLDDNEADVLFIYGVIDGVEELSQFLQKADDNQVVFCLSSFEEMYFMTSRLDALNAPLIKNIWFFIDHPLCYQPLDVFLDDICLQETKHIVVSDALEKWSDLIQAELFSRQLRLVESQDFGLQSFRNHISNALLQDWISAYQVRESLKEHAVVLCGAGPSLSQNLEEMRAASKTCVIAAVGTAAMRLTNANLSYDLHFTLDPKTEKEVRSQYSPTAVLAAMGRVDPEIAKEFPKKIHFGFSDLYPLLEELSALRGVPIDLDAGWNSGTFSLSALQWMGCEKVYLVGFDSLLSREGALRKKDFFLGNAWFDEHFDQQSMRIYANVSHQKLNKCSLGAFARASSKCLLPFPQKNMEISSSVFTWIEETARSVERTKRNAEEFLSEKKNLQILASLEIEQEPFYKNHILPLWNHWKPVYLKEGIPEEMGKMLFSQEVCASFETLFKEYTYEISRN